MEKKAEKEMQKMYEKFTVFLTDNDLEDGIHFIRLQLMAIGISMMIASQHKESKVSPTEDDVVKIFDDILEDTKKSFKEFVVEQKDILNMMKKIMDLGVSKDKGKDFPDLSTEEMTTKAEEMMKKMMGGLE